MQIQNQSNQWYLWRLVTQINTNGLTNAGNSVTDEKLNNSDTFNLTGTTIFNSGSNNVYHKTTRPTSSAQVLTASNSTGGLTWSTVSVTGYQGVAWDWKVDDGGTQTIGDGKAIVVIPV